MTGSGLQQGRDTGIDDSAQTARQDGIAETGEIIVETALRGINFRLIGPDRIDGEDREDLRVIEITDREGTRLEHAAQIRIGTGVLACLPVTKNLADFRLDLIRIDRTDDDDHAALRHVEILVIINEAVARDRLENLDRADRIALRDQGAGQLEIL